MSSVNTCLFFIFLYFPGYSNATFLNDSTVLSYRGNGHIFRNLTNLSLNMRTRKRNTAMLHAEKGSSFITLSVQEGFLFLELQSTFGDNMDDKGVRGVSTVSISSQRIVSDGKWHNVHLFMAAPWAQTSRWTLVLDGEIEEASTSKSQAGNLDFLRQGVEIFLGGLAPDAGWALAGCLSTVELGGIALPYFSPSDVNLPRLQQDQFIQTSQNAPLLGCNGASVCEPSPCLNGGLCQDLFNWFNCTCVGGWAGRRCDLYVDTCASNPCRHGNCTVKGLSYECTCDFGYAGVDCEEEVDVCENHLCANGGTCLHGPRTYTCLCPDNYTGPFCRYGSETMLQSCHLLTLHQSVEIYTPCYRSSTWVQYQIQTHILVLPLYTPSVAVCSTIIILIYSKTFKNTAL